MIDFLNETENTEAEAVLSELSIILNESGGGELELIFVDDEQMREINRTTRNMDKPTDVLSFPLEMPGGMAPLGTVIISLDTAYRAAEEIGHSPLDEIKLLFIHGMLHLRGFDHETDGGEMRREEEALVTRFNLPQSLIVRSDSED